MQWRMATVYEQTGHRPWVLAWPGKTFIGCDDAENSPLGGAPRHCSGAATSEDALPRPVLLRHLSSLCSSQEHMRSFLQPRFESPTAMSNPSDSGFKVIALYICPHHTKLSSPLNCPLRLIAHFAECGRFSGEQCVYISDMVLTTAPSWSGHRSSGPRSGSGPSCQPRTLDPFATSAPPNPGWSDSSVVVAFSVLMPFLP